MNTLHQQSHQNIKGQDLSSQVPLFCQHCFCKRGREEDTKSKQAKRKHQSD